MHTSAALEQTEHRIAATARMPDADGRLRVAVDSVPVLIWMAGADSQFEWFNMPWFEFTGRTIEQERGAGWLDGVHIVDVERCAAIYQASFDARQPFTMDVRLRRRDGDYRWVMVTGVPRCTADGAFVGFIGSCVDIDQRKLLEDRLAERARKLRLAQGRHEEFRAALAQRLHESVESLTAAMTMLSGGDPSSLAPSLQIVERELQRLRMAVADCRDEGGAR